MSKYEIPEHHFECTRCGAITHYLYDHGVCYNCVGTYEFSEEELKETSQSDGREI